VPGGARLLVLAVLAATLAVAWLGLGDVWEQAALPQALVVAAVVGKASADAHRLDLTPLVSGYGALALVPALLALASRSSTHTRFAERLKAAPSARAESSIRGRHRKRASR
jgi:hypothetical protein